jgi:hypothetical protein
LDLLRTAGGGLLTAFPIEGDGRRIPLTFIDGNYVLTRRLRRLAF